MKETRQYDGKHYRHSRFDSPDWREVHFENQRDDHHYYELVKGSPTEIELMNNIEAEESKEEGY